MGMEKFLNFMKLNDDDDDEFDDDFLEEDDVPVKSFFGRKETYNEESYEEPVSNYTKNVSHRDYQEPSRKKTKNSAKQSKLVSINNNNRDRGEMSVYVIKPQEFNEAQTVTDFLKDGKTIVINMEGLEVYAAQRIVDFIGGACYALDGTLQAISSNIFIAAPNATEVSGDLREEILNDSVLAPDLNKF